MYIHWRRAGVWFSRFADYAALRRLPMSSKPPQLAVVDDDPHVRIALQRLLEPEGFEVMTFSSGRAFLETLAGRLPDCLIMDIHMPGPNGFETVAILQSRGLQPNVVFASGDDIEELARRHPEARAKILSKPFTSKRLLEALRAARPTAAESHDL